MRRSVKATVWVVVFLGAAGVGAFIAAHSNPFPPEVGGSPETSSPTGTPTSSSGPAVARYRGSIESMTYHQLYVGGRCDSRFRSTFVLSVRNGTVAGTGRAHLLGELRCDFAISQAEVRDIRFSFSGTTDGKVFRLRLEEVQHSQIGSDDYGGFSRTLIGTGETVELPADGGSTRVVLRRADGDRGSYVSVNRIRLSCVTGCPG